MFETKLEKFIKSIRNEKYIDLRLKDNDVNLKKWAENLGNKIQKENQKYEIFCIPEGSNMADWVGENNITELVEYAHLCDIYFYNICGEIETVKNIIRMKDNRDDPRFHIFGKKRNIFKRILYYVLLNNRYIISMTFSAFALLVAVFTFIYK